MSLYNITYLSKSLSSKLSWRREYPSLHQRSFELRKPFDEKKGTEDNIKTQLASAFPSTVFGNTRTMTYPNCGSTVISWIKFFPDCMQSAATANFSREGYIKTKPQRLFAKQNAKEYHTIHLISAHLSKGSLSENFQ